MIFYVFCTYRLKCLADHSSARCQSFVNMAVHSLPQSVI